MTNSLDINHYQKTASRSLYLDESGTTNMNPENLDKFYPVFVLGGVLFSQEAYANFDREFRDLKRKYFDTEDYILHNAEIKRPAKFGVSWLTKKFMDVGFRRRFYFDLEAVVRSADFELMACGIRKWEFIEAWQKMGANIGSEVLALAGEGGAVFSDPYLICLERVLDLALHKLDGDERINIYPEKITRSAKNDPHMKEAVREMKEEGIEKWASEEVRAKLGEFKQLPKSANESGHQLIDLLLGPIGRRVLGRMPSHNDNGLRWNVVAEKMTTEDLIVLPN